MLERAIDFVYGGLIFLILVGLAFAAYHIFWAEAKSPAEQNFESVFSELKVLAVDSCMQVVTRVSDEEYSFVLHKFGTPEPGCSGKPCLCVQWANKPSKCALLSDAKKDCRDGICVDVESTVTFNARDNKAVKVCRDKDNKLSIG